MIIPKNRNLASQSTYNFTELMYLSVYYRASGAMDTGIIRLNFLHLGIAILSTALLCANRSIAQITPDATLPNNSNVRLEGSTNVISGGTTVGANLFHSFSEFSLKANDTALFDNAPNIQNILTRVTGRSVSNIDGLIRALGTANLFIINPNGLVFGKDAKLDIGGSFLASTANSLKFNDGTEFSALSSTQTQPLLTISTPIGLQYGTNIGSIINLGQAANTNNQVVGLEVKPGKTLALFGGYIKIDGGNLTAPGGQIKLIGISAPGTVGIDVNQNLSEQIPNNLPRANIDISNGARVDISAAGGGGILITGDFINIRGGSNLFGGIKPGWQSNGSRAGNIVIDATKAVQITDASQILNQVGSQATGNGGDVIINTGSLSTAGNVAINSSTLGQGSAGNLILKAHDDISLNQTNLNSHIESGGKGKAGNIQIQANSLDIKDKSSLFASTKGGGNAGNIEIKAVDSVLIDNSDMISSVESSAKGNGGNISINARSFALTNAAKIFSDTQGDGNAGLINIEAIGSVTIDSASNQSPSAIFSRVMQGKGKGGEVSINTTLLEIKNGAQINSTSTSNSASNITIKARDTVSLYGKSPNGGASNIYSVITYNGSNIGQGGEINIDTGNLLLNDNAGLYAGAEERSVAGSVIINARDSVSFNGKGSGIYATIRSEDKTQDGGRGGDVRIKAGQISLGDHAIIITNTLANKNAGDIFINSNSLSLSNGAQFVATTEGQGSAGTIKINASDINVSGKSTEVKNGTDSTGQGGKIIIDANQLVVNDKALLSSSAKGQGNSGNIDINVNKLTVANNGKIEVDSKGEKVNSLQEAGNAGDLNIKANFIRLDNNANINANALSANKEPNKPQANINLRSQALVLTRNSSITTNAVGENVIGGNININSDTIAAFKNSDITANSLNFRGGSIIIKSLGLIGKQPEDLRITALGATQNLGGTVQISKPDVDPSNGLIELPVNLVDASRQISNACTPGSRQFDSTFTVTGRSGLPISPNEPLQDQSTSSAWVKFQSLSENSTTVNIKQPSTLIATVSEPAVSASVPLDQGTRRAPTIVEASGWIADKLGNIELVAPKSQFNSHSPRQISISCLD